MQRGCNPYTGHWRQIVSRGDDSVIDAIMMGKAQIFWQGQRLIFPFSKMEAMLYYLLVNGSSSRGELAGLLWSDMPEEAARKNLRNALYLFKKVVDEDVILMPSRSVLLLNSRLIRSIDVQRLSSGTEAVMDLYGGDFLADFCCKDAALFSEWAEQMREHLREEYIRCLTSHIVANMKVKKYNQAKLFLNKLILTDEYNEGAYRTLMRIYEAAGEYNKVIDIYHQLKSRLQSELGIAPDKETTGIVERVKSRKIPLAPRERQRLAELFFGRKTELNLLNQWLADFCADRNNKYFIILFGELGVGKSALLNSAIHNWTGGKVLRTQCYQPEFYYPYKAWSAIFAQVMTALDELNIMVPTLWRQIIYYVFPATMNELKMPADMLTDVRELQPTMIEEVMCGLISRLAAKERLVIVIDDIHWMDCHGITVLQNVLRNNRGRVVCLAACRAEELDEFDRNAGEWLTQPWVERLAVERFNEEEVARFTALALPNKSLDAEARQKLYEYSEGNALFLVECLNLLQLGQEISKLSPRLQSVLKERMNHLSEKGRSVIETASTFFKNPNYEKIKAVAGLNEFELVEALEEIQHKRLLLEVEVDHGATGSVYQFGHGRVRDFVYEQMSSSRRALLHSRIGSFIESKMDTGYSARDMLHDAIYHYARAGEDLKVLEYQIRLAELYSCPHYEMFPESNEKNGECGYDRRQITSHLELLERLIQEAGEKLIGAGCLSRYRAAQLEMSGRYYIWRGDHRRGLREIHNMLRLIKGQTDDHVYQIRGYYQVIYCGIQRHGFRMINRFADKLIKLANETGQREVMGNALRFKGLAYALQKDTETAEHYYRQSIAWFNQMKGAREKYNVPLAAAYNYIGDLRRNFRCNLDEALYYYETAIKVYGQGAGEGLVMCYINAGCAAFEMANNEKAEEYLMESIALVSQFKGQMGYWIQRGQCALNCVLAVIAVQKAAPEQGLTYLKQAEAILANIMPDAYLCGVVLRSKMMIRNLMERDNHTFNTFCDTLLQPAYEYEACARQNFRQLGSLYDLKMLEQMSSVK